MNAPTPSAVGLCDSHVHVVGDPARYPLVAARTYTPPPAPLDALQRHGAPLGVTRFVIVQPSFYGTDNSLLLEALAALGGQGRGVAVIDPAATDAAALRALNQRGVRGLRINLYSTLSAQEGKQGGTHALVPAFEAMVRAARTQDWHVEVIAPAATLVEAAPLLGRAPVPVVLDHYGLHQGHAPDSQAARALLDLLRLPHVWMKLSAPYRSSDDALAVRPDAAWLHAILKACAARCVWGSDWPHTPPHAQQTGSGIPLPYRALPYRAVLDGFRDALPPGTDAEGILRDNPARLYGF